MIVAMRNTMIGAFRVALLSAVISLPNGAFAAPGGAGSGIKGMDAPKPEAVLAPPVVVMLRINGEDVTVAQYAAYLQANTSYLPEQRTQAGKAKAIRAMVSDLLLRKQIAKERLAEGDSKEQMLAAFSKLAEKHFPLPSPADDETVKQYYLDHINMYGIPEMMRVSQIQFRFSRAAPEDQRTGVRKLAEETLRRIESGEDFAKVAGEMSQNQDARGNNGDLGFLPKGDLDWLDEALKGVHVGEHTRIVETPAGYEILKLTDERPGLPSPLDLVHDRVVRDMQFEAQDRLREAYVRELAAQSKIEVVGDQFKAIFPDGVYPPQ